MSPNNTPAATTAAYCRHSQYLFHSLHTSSCKFQPYNASNDLIVYSSTTFDEIKHSLKCTEFSLQPKNYISKYRPAVISPPKVRLREFACSQKITLHSLPPSKKKPHFTPQTNSLFSLQPKATLPDSQSVPLNSPKKVHLCGSWQPAREGNFRIGLALYTWLPFSQV